MVYDIIIVGWGASGLFCSLFLPKEWKKCIIEKTDRFGAKVLLSGGERCNMTNSNLNPQVHYVGQSLKSLPSLFHTFWPQDMIAYLHDHGIETVEEANGRVLLKSWKAKQLVEFLINQAKNNDTEFLLSHEVSGIMHRDDLFVLQTSAGEYTAKKVIIATWGMTYPQIGASPFSYEIAERLWLAVAAPHAALCGMELKEDVSVLSGSTVQSIVTLYWDNKRIYSSKWSLLFTHRWLSGPLIFDASLYMCQDNKNYTIQCDFDLAGTSKKVLQFLKLKVGDTVRDFRVASLRPITEAKVSVWGILLKSLDQSFQSKNIPWLYFIGESVDITGKTWGFNLQWAWTSAYVCAKKIQNLEFRIQK